MNAPSRREMRLIPRRDIVRVVAVTTARWRRRLNAGTGRRLTVRTAVTPDLAPTTAHPRRVIASNDRDLSDALRTVIQELPASEITEFIDTVTGADENLDPALWGDAPSTAEAARAHLANLTAKFADRQTVLAQSITRADAAHLLGISDQAISDRLNAGDL